MCTSSSTRTTESASAIEQYRRAPCCRSVRWRLGVREGKPVTVSPYDVLGVPPGASPAEIRRAYLRLARRHHPDAGGNAAEMRRLNEAWAALSVASPGSNLEPGVEPTPPV